MKISVHLEADSAEELQAFFASFQAVKELELTDLSDSALASISAAVKKEASDLGLAREGAVIRSNIEAPKPEQPVEDTPETPEPVEEPEAPEHEQPAAKKARKPRGPNKKKDAPAEPAIDLETPAPKAEAQANGEVTREDLLAVFGEYVQRYGVSFGYTDISTLLQKTLGDGIRKASDVPDEAIGQAVEAIRGAITANPFNRKRDYA